MTGVERGIVTPEAVRLEFENADVGARILGGLVDLTVQGVALLVITIAGSALASGVFETLPQWAGIVVITVAVSAVLFGYPIVLETLWRGRTLGKAVLGERAVTVEGAPVRFRHAAIRSFFLLVDVYATLGLGAFLSILLSPRRQRLGDLVAGTLVLRERTAAPRLQAVRFTVPAGAESYAVTVDAGGLDAGDYATIRAFLLRAAAMDPASRARVGAGLASRFAAKLAHVPPPYVPPELFLAVAAARYQARFDRTTTAAAPAAVSPPASPGWAGTPSIPAPASPPVPPGWGGPPPGPEPPRGGPEDTPTQRRGDAPTAPTGGGFSPPA